MAGELSVRPKYHSRPSSGVGRMRPPKCHTRPECLLTAALGSRLSSTGDRSPVFLASMHQKWPTPIRFSAPPSMPIYTLLSWTTGVDDRNPRVPRLPVISNTEDLRLQSNFQI